MPESVANCPAETVASALSTYPLAMAATPPGKASNEAAVSLTVKLCPAVEKLDPSAASALACAAVTVWLALSTNVPARACAAPESASSEAASSTTVSTCPPVLKFGSPARACAWAADTAASSVSWVAPTSDRSPLSASRPAALSATVSVWPLAATSSTSRKATNWPWFTVPSAPSAKPLAWLSSEGARPSRLAALSTTFSAWPSRATPSVPVSVANCAALTVAVALSP